MIAMPTGNAHAVILLPLKFCWVTKNAEAVQEAYPTNNTETATKLQTLRWNAMNAAKADARIPNAANCPLPTNLMMLLITMSALLQVLVGVRQLAET